MLKVVETVECDETAWFSLKRPDSLKGDTADSRCEAIGCSRME
jgi:hypothetical protein